MVLRRRAGHAEALGQLEHGRALEHRAVLEQDDRDAVAVDAADRQQLTGLAVALDVEPARRDAIAHEEVAQIVRLLREAVADDPYAARRQRGARLPRRQQVFDDREQLFLGRVPRLQQVVVERDLVDRRDRRLGVGVRRQQHALGVGRELSRLEQILRAGHRRHPLVGDQHRDLVTARAQLAQHLEPLCARARAEDPKALAEAAAQVTRDRREDRRLVVHGDDRRAAHR